MLYVQVVLLDLLALTVNRPVTVQMEGPVTTEWEYVALLLAKLGGLVKIVMVSLSHLLFGSDIEG